MAGYYQAARVPVAAVVLLFPARAPALLIPMPAGVAVPAAATVSLAPDAGYVSGVSVAIHLQVVLLQVKAPGLINQGYRPIIRIGSPILGTRLCRYGRAVVGSLCRESGDQTLRVDHGIQGLLQDHRGRA